MEFGKSTIALEDRGKVTSVGECSASLAFAELLFSRSRGWMLLRAAIVAVGCLAGLFFLGAIIFALQPSSEYGKDFAQDYIMARALASGEQPYLPMTTLVQRYIPEVKSIVPHPTPHPPPAALLFYPLAYLNYPTAVRVWLVVEVGCLIGSLVLLWRSRGRRVSVGAFVIIFVVSLVWYPVFEELATGQLTMVVLLCLVGARFALLKRQTTRSGILIGLSLLVKPIAAPLLLTLVVRREWRLFWSSSLTFVAGYAAATAAMGPGQIAYYFLQVLPLVGMGYRAASRNQSLWTIGWRLFSGTQSVLFGIHFADYIAAPPLLPSATLATTVALGLPAAVLVIAAIVTWKQPTLDQSLAIMLCVSLLVSPTSWNFYLVLLAWPLFVVIERLAERRFPWRLTLVAVATVIPTFFPYFLVAEWAESLTARFDPASPPGQVAFGFALLTLGPCFSVAALTFLLGRLQSTSAYLPAR